MTKSPFPGDARFAAPNAHEGRFDLPPLNLEVRSQNMRVVGGAKFE